MGKIGRSFWKVERNKYEESLEQFWKIRIKFNMVDRNFVVSSLKVPENQILIFSKTPLRLAIFFLCSKTLSNSLWMNFYLMVKISINSVQF